MYIVQGKAYDSDIGKLVGTIERKTKCATREQANKFIRAHLKKTKTRFPYADTFIIGVIERE